MPTDNGADMPRIAGWREWAALPGLGIPFIKAKLDTGARTSTIHTFFVERRRAHGRDRVRFGLHPLQRRASPEIICEADLLDARMVSDSGGHRERRYIIETPIRLGDEEWRIEASLTDRESMLFRMLLGRTAIKNRFAVDPARSYVFGRRRRREIRTAYEAATIQESRSSD